MLKILSIRKRLLSGSILLPLLIIAALASACGRDDPAFIVYVDPGGDDSNLCLAPSEACATINAGLAKAEEYSINVIDVAGGTYRESLGSLHSDLELRGAGPEVTIVQAPEYQRIVTIGDDTTPVVTISGMTFTEVSTDSPETGVTVNMGSSLTLRQVNITGITASTPEETTEAGYLALYNKGTVILDEVNIFENYTDGGGTIHNSDDGHMTITDSRIYDNHAENIAPAIENYGTITITDTIIRDNRSPTFAVVNYGDMVLEFVQLINNLSDEQGAIANQGTLEISLSSIVGFNGPAITNLQVADLRVATTTIMENAGGLDNRGSVDMEATLLYANRGDAAIRNHSDGVLSLINVTISGSDADWALDSLGTATLKYVTIYDNREIGLGVYLDGSTTIENSIIAANRFNCDIEFTGLDSLEVNISDDDSCPAFSSSNTDLLLDPLADNGGPTWTHALMEDSPAGDSATGECPATDQRGQRRPGGDLCDVGAYEELIFEFDPSVLTPEDPVVPGEPIVPIMNTDSLCWAGPGNLYEVISSIQQGTEVELIGVGAQDGWLVVDNPLYSVPCWLPEDNLEVDPSIDITTLEVFPIPPLPTPTSTPVPQPVAPNAPSSLAANETACDTNNGYVVKLSWKDAANNEDGYRVYRGGQLLATIGANATQYTDNPPGSGPYSYYVQAFNNAGTANSNTAQEDGCIF